MRAYYFDDLPGDQRLAHDFVPSRPVSKEVLDALNVKSWSLPADAYEAELDAIAKEQGYTNRDVMTVSKDALGSAYDGKIKSMFDEHIHDEEEARFILSGSGFYDIRETSSDQWIRLAFGPGDLISLPIGSYHRFTPDEDNNIEALRLFRDEPKWNRFVRSKETDANPHRIAYLKGISA
ncbi:Acireductone dioxygenase ARD family [Gymnopilus junonius]|uniref:Acireductone dioxygenase n=1 Tax=Gymnopilus junonius TaxID=109634 RepID=A0A9P5TIN6_GYMJU|nr:Acireductone dioxygenase ARD family [Gymnopilus junonius]